MENKIVITGGHFTPAYAVVEVLKKRGWEVYWIGVNRGIESKILPNLKIPFYPIDTFKYSRHRKILSLLSLGQVFVGIYQSTKLLLKLKPEVVLSFGSFVSFPVAIASWILGIPIVIHEQTSASGLANRLVSQLSEKVAISFETSRGDFPSEKVVFTGNSIRSSIFAVAKKRGVKSLGKPPVLYITGGSRGSQSINDAILEILQQLSKKYYVILQTGDLDFQRVSAKIKSMKLSKGSFEIHATLTPQEVEKVFLKCDFAISRSGANTVSEIAVLGIPAIFIPLPNTESNEQFKNASLLEEVGLAQILEQSELSGKELLERVNLLHKNFKKYQANSPQAKKLIPAHANEKIVDIILDIQKGV